MSGMDQKFAKLAADDGQRLNSLEQCTAGCNSTPAPNNERMHQKFTKTRRTPLWSLAGSALADLTDTSTPPFFAQNGSLLQI